jgi:hypothetical protein
MEIRLSKFAGVVHGIAVRSCFRAMTDSPYKKKCALWSSQLPSQPQMHRKLSSSTKTDCSTFFPYPWCRTGGMITFPKTSVDRQFENLVAGDLTQV